jgi:hypothetical protein
MKRKSAQIKFNSLVVAGSVGPGGEGRFDIKTDTRLGKADFKSPDSRFQLSGVRIKLPLLWPAEHFRETGSIKIAAMRYGKFDLGFLRADLNQTASGLAFSGRITTELLPALSAKFAGNSDFFGLDNFETRVHFEIFYPERAPEIDLGKFLPAAKGFTFKGKFLEEGDLFIGKNGFSGKAKSIINDGQLTHRQNKIEIGGIQMSLLITELPAVRSAPGQQLKFSKAAIGGINLQEGQIDFQIESHRAALIEKSHFKWCDGNVDAPAIRVTSGVEDYNLVLYCDRLNLAKVLSELSAARVEAQGELNGRVALRYQNGLLSFNDGFLYSTPGEPGKIRMLDTEILTAGIPPDTPQYVQMELARKALEDYDYSWAKLKLTTEGEDLLLKMQLDGKPAKPLPFVYRKDIGSFAKIEADMEGSHFQGIRLDVNFRLPLNKIMQYKDLIQMIQQEKE